MKPVIKFPLSELIHCHNVVHCFGGDSCVHTQINFLENQPSVSWVISYCLRKSHDRRRIPTRIVFFFLRWCLNNLLRILSVSRLGTSQRRITKTENKKHFPIRDKLFLPLSLSPPHRPSRCHSAFHVWQSYYLLYFLVHLAFRIFTQLLKFGKIRFLGNIVRLCDSREKEKVFVLNMSTRIYLWLSFLSRNNKYKRWAFEASASWYVIFI